MTIQRMQLALPSFAVLIIAGCDILSSVPGAIPAEIVTVNLNRSHFDGSNHPLATTLAGTALDDLTGLDGCWGRVGTEESTDPSTLRVGLYPILETLQFDAGSGRLVHHRLLDYDGDFTLTTGRPLLQTFVADYSTHDGNRITRSISDGQAGVVLEDGTIAPEFLGLVGVGISVGHVFDTLVTRQGDYLKTADGSIDEPPDPDVGAKLWVRLSCATP